MFTKKRTHKLISILFILAILLSNVHTPVASAQTGDGLKRQVNPESGRVSFIGPDNGRVVPAAKALGAFFRPQDPAMALANRFAPEFGIQNPARELSAIKTNRPADGRVIVRYQQAYQGIPVMGGELIVNTNKNGDLYSMSGEVSPNLALPTQPKIDSVQAAETALQALAKWYQKTPADFVASTPELWIFDESLLKPSNRPVELVWRMEVTPKELGMPVRELVLVNAERGNISLHFNQVDTAWGKPTDVKNEFSLIPPICTVQNGSGAGNLFFRPYVQFNCGLTGHGVGVGDFNNDGKNDVALAVQDGVGFQRTLLIFFQDNNGSFSQPISYPTGNLSDYLAVGDLNNDGLDDVVTLDSFDNTISVYLQNNSNTLNNRVTYSTNSQPQTLAVGDVNNDGLDDVAIANYSTIGVLTQKNDGTLNALITYSGANSDGNDIAIGDVNNDGLNDVVNMKGGATTETLLVYIQNNSHTLNPYYSISNCSLDCGGRGIEIADITSDGREDLVMSFGGNGNSAKIAVFRQDGNGNLQPPIIYPSKDIPSPVEIADMNSDSKPDVVVLHTGWLNAGVYSQQSNGTLGTEALYSIPYQSYKPQDVSIGDVNNDGLADILIADGQGLVILYRRSPTPDIVSVDSGANQVALLQNPFSQLLKVKIKNYVDLPVVGATVTFTAPASGASTVFTNTGTNITTAVTDANGIATASAISANNIHGTYMVTAMVTGSASSADFQLTNVDSDLPTTGLISSGSGQSTLPQTQFPQPLKVLVQNYLAQPISGITVTFTAPASGASAVFMSNGTNITTTITDANGIATSSTVSSNNVKGVYVVKATVNGLASSVDFQLVNGAKVVQTYTANNGISLPGVFLCDQTILNCTNGSNPHADAAHKYAMGTFDLYAAKHIRDSLDNAGMTIISSVHYDSLYGNAFWDGSQAVYGDSGGWPLADDVVAHELTHGVTEHESNLFYFYQSGAINEALSDLWGEYYDQTNGQGNDTAGAKWQVGEDISDIGVIRSMSDPTIYGDPDRMTSGSYYNGDGDSGGVHYNSGVNNKAVYLMVEGGFFNGKTVAALGWDKTASIYYEANTNLLTSGSNYSDLYYALQEACKNLTGRYGITLGDCDQVKNALDAVEMSASAYGGFYPAAPECAPGLAPSDLFQDKFEGGISNWDVLGSGQWRLDNWYATSATHMMWGDDFASSSDSMLTMKNGVYLAPGNYYLHFRHAFLFENKNSIYYDGGVLEYSTNNGATWLDAAPLFSAGKNYSGTVDATPGTSNALKGRWAFVGDSHGYVSSRYDLAALSGQTVKFRWRFATDQYIAFQGWVVDDVQIYKCVPHISGNAGAAWVTLSYTDGTPKTVLSDGKGNYTLPISSGWSGTVTPSLAGVTFTPANRSYSNVTVNQIEQNYTASIALTGNVGAAGVTLSYVDGTPKTVTADGSGNYTITVPYGWSGTVTPSLNTDAFCPASQSYANLTTSRTRQNYAHEACRTFDAISKWTSAFDLSHGWTVASYVRTAGDVNNDGKDDLIGFGQDGVYVALSNGTSFDAISKWTSAFDLSHGWTVKDYVRTVGDVNNDGRADLVGFGQDGVYVALSNGTSFDAISKWTSAFDLSHGWTVASYVRTVGDVNNDGRADLVGFGQDGVYVALSNGTSFGAISKWTSAFDLSHGWTVKDYVRTVGDVNNDGRADLIGFGQDGVYVALSNGTSFDAISKWTSAFDLSHGWTVKDYVRTVGDVNNDGRVDLIGFGQDGVYIALSMGTTFSLPSRRTTSFDLAHGWTVASYVRTVGDVSGDGKADLVGFGLDGVYVVK